MSQQILLTGVTGFVGKVVLHNLLARKDELDVARVVLMIRESHSRDGTRIAPIDRFLESVAKSEIFRDLPADWASAVEVVGCDLEEARCGLSDDAHRALVAQTTHIIHCAASVEFDLPIAEAAKANIATALNVLALAKECTQLSRLVAVSTAYVSVWHSGEIREELAHLPRPAEEYYQAITTGAMSEQALLSETGHPNTYTFTKCLAEHLLAEQRGPVPLTIVRPSIVSAAWQEPFAGWIDSAAALAGCLLYSGLGLVRAFHADPAVRLDVVPVDVVARITVDASNDAQPFAIRYAVMGIENALRVDMAALSTVAYFRERPGARVVPDLFIGKAEHGFHAADTMRRAAKTLVARAALAATGRTRDRRRLEKVDAKARYLNDAFRYFTHHTFDFRPAQPVTLEGFDPVAYSAVINRGLYRHLLSLDEREMPLAGASHDDARSDLQWVRERDTSSWSMRVLALGMRKALRVSTSGVTFDRTSFERAVALAPADALFVLAPSHRSYFDFLLSSYLCLQHPELKIAVPHIAAAEEFGKIPVVGAMLRASRAFYIRRGVGKEVPELSEELRRIAGMSGSVMFFIEGQRSRARLFLSPKRGLLRGLQATGRTFAVLPIAISYDRVPEEAAFERELTGGKRSRMSLGAIAQWLAQLALGKVHLGRVHMACGEPLVLAPDTDVATLARAVVGEQQQHMAVTRFHLRTYLAHARLPLADENWLVAAIRERGGTVLDSELPRMAAASAPLRQSLSNQWMHWFYADAAALFPRSIAVTDHVARNAWSTQPSRLRSRAPDLVALVTALMTPIVRDYERVAEALLAARPHHALPPTPLAFVAAHPSSHLPYVEDCYRALRDRGILADDGAWGPAADDLASFGALCALEPAPLQRVTPARAKARS